MKVLVIGDPHFKTSNVKETDEMVESILKIAKEVLPKFIVILGDVLDRHELIHVSPFVRANKFIFSLSELSKVYLLIGNHDLKNNRQFLSDEHPFYSLKDFENIVVVDKVICETIDNRIFTMVPYVPPGMFIKALNTCQILSEISNATSNEISANVISNEISNDSIWHKSDLIFAHQEFRGCKMGAIISEEGDEWNMNYPPVISGHIHNYQELGNIVYVGTPIQHGYDDSIDKTISLLEFNENKNFIHKRIDLNCRKKKIIRISVADVSTYEADDKYDLRIYISGSPGEIKGIMKHPNISKWKSKGISIKFKDIAIGGVKEKTEKTREIMPYLQMIQEAIANHENAMQWYKELILKQNN